jgi:hypothetical protein
MEDQLVRDLAILFSNVPAKCMSTFEVLVCWFRSGCPNQNVYLKGLNSHPLLCYQVWLICVTLGSGEQPYIVYLITLPPSKVDCILFLHIVF